jgi:gas vesicle protein
MSKFVNFLAGLLFGALIGAAVALLLAPMSGERLREEAQARAEKTVDDVRASIEEERQRLQAELEALKRGEIKIN